MAGVGRGGRTGLTRGLRVRWAVAVVLAALAGLGAPVSLLSGWAWSQLSNTDAFVATFAPLARDSAVQQLVSEKVSSAVLTKAGVVGHNPLAQDLVRQSVTQVVSSEAFAGIWEKGLRTAHTRLRALLAGEPGKWELNDGALQIQLGPFSDAVRERLVTAGVPFADRLPTIEAAVTVAQLDPALVAQIRSLYRALELVAAWSPWLALLAGIGAVLTWPTPRGGLIAVGVALVLGTIAASIAGVVALNTVSGHIGPTLAAQAALVLPAAVGPLLSPVLALAMTAVALLFTGALARRTPDAT
jgi:hypothetical protein